jgi:hypothetical protein
MGRIRHDAIILTGTPRDLEPVRDRALQHFQGSCVRVSEMTGTTMNATASFLVAPDGSKEGWRDSDEGDRLRDAFVKWLQVEGPPLIDWIEVQFGGDESHEAWVRTPTDDEFRRAEAGRDA